MLTWLKTTFSLATLAAISAAILFAFRSMHAGQLQRQATRKADKAALLKNANTSRELQQGRKLEAAANNDLDKGVELRAAALADLDRMGAQSHEIDKIADRFNSRRLRKRPAG